MQVFFAAESFINNDGSNSSLLYTGDISLNGARVDDIKKLVTPARWSAIEILQVPHHGAASSWTAGLAAKFSHRYSVFSSARYHPTYLHPREEVLTDLENTKCVLVNEYTGAVFHGGAHWETARKTNTPAP
jgi:beta-lactamase superfamily II metal-dependent hydrolase